MVQHRSGLPAHSPHCTASPVERPTLGRAPTTPPARGNRIVVALLIGVALLLSACNERNPGPIADIEGNGFTLTARAEGERWYDVTESRDAGFSWTQLDPERYGSDDPNDPNFGFDAPQVELEAMLQVCSEQICWRAAESGIERSNDGGTTWAEDFLLPEGRERFSPDDYPVIVDMTIVREKSKPVVIAATAENGLLLGRPDGTWLRRSIDHWQAPDLTGSLIHVWPELMAVVIAAAIALSILVLLAFTIMRRAHEQISHSIVSLLAVLGVAPAAYYATLPLLDWADGTIVARQDAIDDSIAAATFYGVIALIVVVVLSLLVRFRWSRRLGPLPFPDTPA